MDGEPGSWGRRGVGDVGTQTWGQAVRRVGLLLRTGVGPQGSGEAGLAAGMGEWEQPTVRDLS